VNISSPKAVFTLAKFVAKTSAINQWHCEYAILHWPPWAKPLTKDKKVL
jgi:hypothetical protein